MLLAVAASALFAALGVWQLERAAAKQGLIDAFEAGGGAPRIVIEPGRAASWGASSGEALRYRPALARGRYLAARQYLLDNRTRAGRAGYHVLTPLLIGPRVVLLVNRGWVPLGSRRDRLPAVPVPSGELEVRGRLAPAAPPTPVLGETGYGSGGWPRVVERVELEPMRAELGLEVLPVAMLLDPQARGGFERDWHPRIYLSPERHRGYAVQWFALAFGVPVLYLAVSLRRGRHGRDRSA